MPQVFKNKEKIVLSIERNPSKPFSIIYITYGFCCHVVAEEFLQLLCVLDMILKGAQRCKNLLATVIHVGGIQKIHWY